ncbi:MAG: ribosome maturation factor RimM [Thermodesulfobacteriota bacterium]
MIRPHGVRGKIQVDCHGVAPQEVLTLTEVRIGPKVDHLTIYRVLRIKPYKGLLILELEGFSHELALASVGQTVWVDRAQLPPLEEGEYYWEDLVGLRLVTEGGEEGTVEAVLTTGSNEVLVCSCRGREILVPFIHDVVVRVDLDQGLLVIRALDQWM